MSKSITLILSLLVIFVQGQVTKNDTIRVENYPTDSLSSVTPKSELLIESEIQEANTVVSPTLSPIKAGLYSAVLPGLGQYYNKKLWKVPIVWGALGTGVGVTLWNDKQYKRYREAFIAELNGQPHEFSDIPGITKGALGRTQDKMKRQKDYSIAVTALVYVLNIMDAVVDAHLYQQRNDPDLALKPVLIHDEYSTQWAKAGISLNYNF